MAEKYNKVIADKKIQAERLMNKNQIKNCNIAIHTASAASAAGVIPIPVADAVPITATQVTMVIALGKIFDVKVTESIAKGLIGAAASTFVGRNLVKMIPIIGWGISAAVAAGVTEAIGWTIAVDFAKEAKNRWDNEYKSSDSTYEHESDSESSSENTDGEKYADKSEYYMDLAKRAEDFISRVKKRSEYEDEYETLRSEFEKILDDLPLDHTLRKQYDELCAILD